MRLILGVTDFMEDQALPHSAPGADGERQCILLGRKARARQVRRRAAELEREKHGPSFGRKVLIWRYVKRLHPSRPGRAIAALLALPFVAAFDLLGLIVAPFEIIRHRLRQRPRIEAEIQLLEAQAAALEADPGNIEATGHKTLLNLWQQYGLDGDYNEQVALLNAWLHLLYGSSVASTFDVAGMVKKKGQRQGMANRRYASGESLIHYGFGDPLLTVIRQISDSLPPYPAPPCPKAAHEASGVERLEQLRHLWPRLDFMMQESWTAWFSQAVDGWRASRLGQHELQRWLYAFDGEVARRLAAQAELLDVVGAGDETPADEVGLPFPSLPDDFRRAWLNALSIEAREQYCRAEMQLLESSVGYDAESRLDALESVLKGVLLEKEVGSSRTGLR